MARHEPILGDAVAVTAGQLYVADNKVVIASTNTGLEVATRRVSHSADRRASAPRSDLAGGRGNFRAVTMPWRPGALSGHPDYEIHDELYTPDGRCVAVIECFATSPTIYYCNAITLAGEWRRMGAGRNLDTTRRNVLPV